MEWTRIGLVVATAFIAVGCTPSDDKRIEILLDAFAATQLDEDVGGFTEDAELVLADGAVVRGHTAIQDYFAWRRATHTTVSVAPLVSHASCFESGELHVLLAAGNRRCESVTIELHRGRVARFVAGEPTAGSRERYETRLNDFASWLQDRYPDQVERVLNGGRWRRNAAVAHDQVRLLEAWRHDTAPLEVVASIHQTHLPFGELPEVEVTLVNRSDESFRLVANGSDRESAMRGHLWIVDTSGRHPPPRLNFNVPPPPDRLASGASTTFVYPAQLDYWRSSYRGSERALLPGVYRWRMLLHLGRPDYPSLISHAGRLVVIDDGSDELRCLRQVYDPASLKHLRLTIELRDDLVSLYAINTGWAPLCFGENWWWEYERDGKTGTWHEGPRSSTFGPISPGERVALQGMARPQGPGTVRVRGIYHLPDGRFGCVSNTLTLAGD